MPQNKSSHGATAVQLVVDGCEMKAFEILWVGCWQGEDRTGSGQMLQMEQCMLLLLAADGAPQPDSEPPPEYMLRMILLLD